MTPSNLKNHRKYVECKVSKHCINDFCMCGAISSNWRRWCLRINPKRWCTCELSGWVPRRWRCIVLPFFFKIVIICQNFRSITLLFPKVSRSKENASTKWKGRRKRRKGPPSSPKWVQTHASQSKCFCEWKRIGKNEWFQSSIMIFSFPTSTNPSATHASSSFCRSYANSKRL